MSPKDPTYTVQDFHGSLSWLHERMGRPVYISMRSWPSDWQAIEVTGYLASAVDLGTIPAIARLGARAQAITFIIGYTPEPTEDEQIAQVVIEPHHFLQGFSRVVDDTAELNLEFKNKDLRFTTPD